MPSGNPYITDRPLNEADLFVGRFRLLVRVAQGLKRGHQITLVYGPVHIGRTSFLNRLPEEIPSDFVVLRAYLTRPELVDAERLMKELLAAVGEGLSGELGQPVTDLDAALDTLLDRRVVILVDGLSVTDLCTEAGIEFVGLWQGWVTARPKVHFVVALSGRPEGSALPNAALASMTSIELKGLTLGETEDLLAKPAKGRLTYDYGAMRRIWQVTSGHPYFVQLFGYALFNVRSGRGRVGVHDVEEVMQDVLTAASPVMERIWEGCSPHAQLILAISNELRGRHGVLTTTDLKGESQRLRIKLTASETEAGLDDALAVGVLRRLSAETYSFELELHHAWLARHKALPQVARSLRGRRRLFGSRGYGEWRAFPWSTVGLWTVGIAMLLAVVKLWSMRGAARHFVMGGLPTKTAPPVATRATLVIGPALGQVVYTAKEHPDADWDIWVMRGDGSDPKRLTDDPGTDLAPTWSPDGKHIAFVSDRSGNREIYVMKADGTGQIDLTQHPSEDWTPAWSPDGTAIAFSSYRDANWEIYVMAPDGSDPWPLTQDPAADYNPCWSPDSQQIAFNSNRDGNWEIYVVNRDGTGLQRLTEDEATDFGPAWSPDGTMIAFESYRDGNMEIYLMATDGSQQRNLTNAHYSNEHGPAWARRGTRLLYYSNVDGGWDIFSTKPDGTEHSNLTLSSAFEQNPEWSE